MLVCVCVCVGGWVWVVRGWAVSKDSIDCLEMQTADAELSLISEAGGLRLRDRTHANKDACLLSAI